MRDNVKAIELVENPGIYKYDGWSELKRREIFVKIKKRSLIMSAI